MEQSLGKVLEISETSRCLEKVSQDYVFVQVSLPNMQVQISTKEPKYTLVDRLGLFGKKHVRMSLTHFDLHWEDGCIRLVGNPGFCLSRDAGQTLA